MNDDGEPQVIEYNVRMGDPETEAIFPRLKTDMVSMLMGIANGNLGDIDFELDSRSAATVFVVSEGYPGSIQKGKKMNLGIETIEDSQYVFHAGVKLDGTDLLTNGGRVTAVTVLEETLDLAITQAQKLASEVNFEGATYRKDIGLDLLKYGN